MVIDFKTDRERGEKLTHAVQLAIYARAVAARPPSPSCSTCERATEGARPPAALKRAISVGIAEPEPSGLRRRGPPNERASSGASQKLSAASFP